MNWKKIGAVLIALLLLTALSGCIELPLGEEHPLTITDDLGREVAVPEVISLAPSNTEKLFAVGAGDRVVGVTDFCDYPREAQEKDKIGGFATVNIEKVVALAPDLILATGIHEPIIEDLERLNLTVVVLDPKNVDDILGNIRLTGRITGQVETAEELATNMEHRINAITDRTKELPDAQKPKVFYIVWNDPLMTAGPGTFTNDLIHLVGEINIAGDAETRYPVYSLEMLVKQNPDVIIFSTHAGVTAEQLKTDDVWQGISAIETGRIFSIDADIISRPGPRIVDGLEEMAKYIHLNHDCYLPTTKPRLLDLEEVIDNLRNLEVEKVVFMGGEPTIDPELYNILLTNGLCDTLGDLL